ncbi:proline dehydrogenase family protein [Rhodocaloribacter litoris]|uniref:proline dehydrogenase family protein n=1 Tax=Rhodocaloribacter litoris TaxID=2558931 RepID=UPI001E5AB82B|nr:proline dehydrogenase family protein [Rhodocaloribacter litoris]
MRLPFILARRFVAAETLEGTLPIVHELNRKGLLVTLDLLGEYIDEKALANEACDLYIDLLRTLSRERAEHGLRATISIKLSMIGQKIDYDFGLGNLKRLLAVARQTDIFVRLDMEGSDVTESTLSMFEEVYPDYPDHVGIVLQAYLKRTAQDVERMCALKARVRLCKGAYKEPASIAYQNMDDIRARFIEYMQHLLLHGRYPAIATHDDRLIDATKRFVAEKSIDRDAFEFQMLYGIRPETQVQIVQEGYRMRIYVPYGRMWLPYFTRRLRERKENIWFVLTNLFRK